MYEAALNILNKLDKLGYESYIVGGFARDLYLKINSSDIDICTIWVVWYKKTPS